MKDNRYLIWSEEHGAWWKAGRTGYTRALVHAGRYGEAEAIGIVGEANRYCQDGTFNEVAMPDPLGSEEL
jgi:hypothetical protein